MYVQRRGVQRTPLPRLAVFQVLIAQNNLCTKVTYFWGGIFYYPSWVTTRNNNKTTKKKKNATHTSFQIFSAKKNNQLILFNSFLIPAMKGAWFVEYETKVSVISLFPFFTSVGKIDYTPDLGDPAKFSMNNDWQSTTSSPGPYSPLRTLLRSNSRRTGGSSPSLRGPFLQHWWRDLSTLAPLHDNYLGFFLHTPLHVIRC